MAKTVFELRPEDFAVAAAPKFSHAEWAAYEGVVPAGALCVTVGRQVAGVTEYFVGDGVHRYAALEKSGNAAMDALAMNDCLYDGVDLSIKFAAEIAGYSDVWAWIQARITAANYKGIHVGDWIPFDMVTYDTNRVAGTVAMQAQIAGIDTYYECLVPQLDHHIDFISKDLYPTSVQWNTTATNNGNATESSPWLASNIYSILNNTWFTYLPSALQSQITTKLTSLPVRYSASGLLTDDNNFKIGNAGKLWLPSEYEISGSLTQSGVYNSGLSMQYPIFKNKSLDKIKTVNNIRKNWWTMTCFKSIVSVLDVSNYGPFEPQTVTNVNYAPICFRIGG